MPDTFAEYMVVVLDLMEQNAYYFSRIHDWPHIRQTILSESTNAKSNLDLYPIIDDLLHLLQDHHSHLRRPEPSAVNFEAKFNAPMPHTSLLEDRWGYLNLPDCSGDEAVVQAYANSGRNGLNQFLDADGWIVDLRENTGGNMFPMLLTVGPLAATEILGKFVNRDGKADSWSYRSSAIYYNDHLVLQSQVTVAPVMSDIPVAILLSSRTASSGEITAISLFGRPNTRTFGQPTRGVPTANSDYELSDGALLLLTTALTADRRGNLYDEVIVPDEVMKDNISESVPPVVIAWLSNGRRVSKG